MTETYFAVFDGGMGFTIYNPLFPRSTRLLAGPESLVEASTDRWEFRFRTPSGELFRIVRREGWSPPSPL